MTCRVASVVDEPNRFGFAYGTLPIHPEQGEQSFIVERDEGGKVTFTLRAKKAGTAHIKMVYRRPWEENKPWGNFDATVTVLP